MIDQFKLFKTLEEHKIRFFCGVPDSHLNAFCTYLAEHIDLENNVITANEGNAIALAAGYHMATGQIPLVYMQNSGLGNAFNPLASLVDKHVFSIPLILLIGWRGDPSEPDHLQHITQGEVTTKLLDILGIPFLIVPDDDEKINEVVGWAVDTACQTSLPVALIARKGVFAESKKKPPVDDSYPMSREDAIVTILDHTPKDTIFVATTGRATRELYFLRKERNENNHCDILNVGSMGHASSIAMGVALALTDRFVVCLDGDAAAIMHMGALTILGTNKMPNIIHVILNNGAHESVGGQPSAGHKISFETIAEGSGYHAYTVDDKASLIRALNSCSEQKTASLIDVRIRQGMRSVLPPLDVELQSMKKNFMKYNTIEEKE